jgi:hypothetical protein
LWHAVHIPTSPIYNLITSTDPIEIKLVEEEVGYKRNGVWV